MSNTKQIKLGQITIVKTNGWYVALLNGYLLAQVRIEKGTRWEERRVMEIAKNNLSVLSY